MLHDWGVIAAAFAYIGLLFFVASHGDYLGCEAAAGAGHRLRRGAPLL